MKKKERLSKLLTLPETIEDTGPLTLTGNEYLSLPEIDQAGGILSLNVLRLDARGLLEFRGAEKAPLLLPLIKINGRTINLEEEARWYYQLDWLPSFTLTTPENCLVKGEIMAPPETRGFLYSISFENKGGEAVEAEINWQGTWASFNYIIFKQRPIEGTLKLDYDQWTKSLILEAASGLPLAALAFAVNIEEGFTFDQESRTYQCLTKHSVAPGENRTSSLFAAVNLERDGAGTTNIDLRRHGRKALTRLTFKWLENHCIKDVEEQFLPLVNRNLFFTYFYASGRCLESEKLVALTSRSPRYYVSAAFWSRDALLWSFPAILMIDEARARALLLAIFARHIANAGDHAHYINGTVLYPGFELDQLAAYILALSRYIKATGDYSILKEKVIYSGLTLLADKALEQFSPEAGLYSTFLDPSDDPAFYPFLTYNNALLERAFHFLGELQTSDRWHYKGDFTILSRELAYAIYEHCTVKGPVGTMFAWSVDGQGKFVIYDNPPGSLQLLAHYGFCSPDDSVYRNTVRWIRSKNNRYFNTGANFEEAGSVHAAKPWPLGACNDLLSCNDGALDFLSRAVMDNGFFCETVNPDTGRVSTGAAFASAAGFLAYALHNKQQKSALCETGEPGEKEEEFSS